MNRPGPLPTPDHLGISFSVIGVGLVLSCLGLLCCLTIIRIVPGILIGGFGGTLAWSQYAATFRRDTWAALIISLQCSLISLTLVMLQGLWIVVRYSASGTKAVLDVFTLMTMLAAFIAVCIWVTTANWLWYLKLLRATRAGMKAASWRQFSIGDMLALMVMIGTLLGMLSFVLRGME